MRGDASFASIASMSISSPSWAQIPSHAVSRHKTRFRIMFEDLLACYQLIFMVKPAKNCLKWVKLANFESEMDLYTQNWLILFTYMVSRHNI